jgi:hypothetical protein
MKINIEMNDSYIGIEGITSKRKKNTHWNGVIPTSKWHHGFQGFNHNYQAFTFIIPNLNFVFISKYFLKFIFDLVNERFLIYKMIFQFKFQISNIEGWYSLKE